MGMGATPSDPRKEPALQTPGFQPMGPCQTPGLQNCEV